VKAKLNLVVSAHGPRQDDAAERALVFISPNERIVTMRTPAELQLKQPHWRAWRRGPPNLEGQGAVRQRQLLINSLRMRPDRIIVGESARRGALDMLQA